MIIKALKTFSDGVISMHEGEIANVPDAKANVFIAEGYAVEYTGEGGDIDLSAYARKTDLEDYAKGEDVSTSYKGKNVVHMGDSWIHVYGLAEGVAENVGYTVTNCGFSATSISDYNEAVANARKLSLLNLAKAIQSNTWTDQDAISNANNWSTQLAKLKAINWSNVDVLILSYGVNDEGAQNPIGDTSARDEESVCGALKSAISIFQSINPSMEIIVTTPCYRYRSADSEIIIALTERNLLEDYRNAIGLTAKSCGVKLIDMRALSGINESNYTTTLRSDGLHPTDLGKTMWVDAFSQALENGYGGAFDISNDFSFEPDNLCFDSEKLTKHKQWNATYTLDGIKYLCTARNRQYGDCVLGMAHFDSLPIGTTISLSGYGRKIGTDLHRFGFDIKNQDKTSSLINKYRATFSDTDGAISYSFTTESEYTDCWVVFYVKNMTAWEDGKALVRDMTCTVELPS